MLLFIVFFSALVTFNSNEIKAEHNKHQYLISDFNIKGWIESLIVLKLYSYAKISTWHQMKTKPEENEDENKAQTKLVISKHYAIWHKHQKIIH